MEKYPEFLYFSIYLRFNSSANWMIPFSKRTHTNIRLYIPMQVITLICSHWNFSNTVQAIQKLDALP